MTVQFELFGSWLHLIQAQRVARTSRYKTLSPDSCVAIRGPELTHWIENWLVCHHWKKKENVSFVGYVEVKVIQEDVMLLLYVYLLLYVTAGRDKLNSTSDLFWLCHYVLFLRYVSDWHVCWKTRSKKGESKSLKSKYMQKSVIPESTKDKSHLNLQINIDIESYIACNFTLSTT